MTASEKFAPPRTMHPASVLVREILVLNEVMEFGMRRKMGLNETDFQALQHLMKHRTMSPGELAQHLHLTAAAATTVIDRLVMKGHVVRTPHLTDRRRSVISPSEESVRRTMEAIMPMIMEVDSQARSYDEAGQEVLVDFLSHVVSSMKTRASELQDEDNAPRPPEPIQPPTRGEAP